jgi:hypothetical protein
MCLPQTWRRASTTETTPTPDITPVTQPDVTVEVIPPTNTSDTPVPEAVPPVPI